MSNPHPDYLSVDEAHRWGKPLPALIEHLMKESYRRRGQWAWSVLPHGALVAMRVNPQTFRRELRIARKTIPGDVDAPGWKRWAKELSIFLAKFGGADRFQLKQEIEGKCDVVYTMLLKGEIPGEACVDCGKPADKGPYREALCTSCATKRGTAETEGRRAPTT